MPDIIRNAETHINVERLAASKAESRVKTSRWDLTSAVIAYALLAAIVMLKLEGIAIEVVAIIGIFGLLLVWLLGWARGKRLFKQIYDEELSGLKELLVAENVNNVKPLLISQREIDVLILIARGNSNKQIAHELSISESTVKNHISSILHKLNVNDRTQAVVAAIDNKWIIPSETEPNTNALDNNN